MENQQNKIINLKLLFLQYKYKLLTQLIIDITTHINIIDNKNLINSHKKNLILTDLYNINKNLNSSNNKYLLEKLTKITINDLYLKILLENFNINNIIEFDENKILMFESFINEIPFKEEESKIKSIIMNHGLINLIKTFNYLFKKIPLNIINLINELNTHFIPVSIQFCNLDNDKNIFLKMPQKYDESDNIEQIRELWIKNKDLIDNNCNFIKIEGIFKNDILSSFINTSQTNFIYLFNKKNKLINELKNTDIDLHFIKRFIKFDYLGNIYCMTKTEYINYIKESYNFFNQLVKSQFVNIMKNFISSGIKIQKLYFTIFLLLLGNNENIDIASLLLEITKEKKINAINIYNLIIRNLPFYLQLKIKNGNNNIKL